MDSLVVKKSVICLILAASGIVLLVWASCRIAESRDQRRQVTAQHSCGLALRSDEARKYVPPDVEERRQYMRIVGEIVSAYSNRNEAAIIELAGRLPPVVFRLRDKDHQDFIYPISRVWTDEWSKNTVYSEFSSASEFKSCMRLFAALSRVYGGLIVKSGLSASDVLVLIDCAVLERLQKYLEEYTRKGQTDYMEVAEDLIADWKGQIESERGFAREYLRSQNRELAQLVKKGELSEETLREYVRSCARPLLQFCGYTPKWIEVEFPRIKGDGNGRIDRNNGWVHIEGN